MSDRILLVQGDTLPQLTVTITQDDDAGAPVDISLATVRLKFRLVGSTTLKATLVGELLTGYDDGSGVVNENPPYDGLGVGGRVRFTWGLNDLDTAGSYEGEVEVASPGAQVQTVYDKLKFKVRAQF